MRLLLTAAEDIHAFSEGSAKAYPKLGLLYLAAHLRQNIYQPERIEFEYHDMLLENLDIQDMRAIVRRFQPDVVGVSCLSYSEEIFHALAKAVKEEYPLALIIGGGPYVSSLRQSVLSDPNVDLIVFDEGETTFTELIERMLDDRDYSDVAGIAFRIDGRIHTTSSRELIENLDDLPIPAFD